MEADPTVALYNFYGWLHTNRKRVVAGAIVVAVIAAIVGFCDVEQQPEGNRRQPGLARRPVAPRRARLRAMPPQPRRCSTSARNTPAPAPGSPRNCWPPRSCFWPASMPRRSRNSPNSSPTIPAIPSLPQANVGIAACLEAQGKISDAVATIQKDQRPLCHRPQHRPCPSN